MEPWAWIVLAVAVVIVAGLAYLLMQQRKSSHLNDRFGPEYERAMGEAGSRRRAAMVHYRTLFEDLLETEIPEPVEARR